MFVSYSRLMIVSYVVLLVLVEYSEYGLAVCSPHAV
jgi:hypothetical protein